MPIRPRIFFRRFPKGSGPFNTSFKTSEHLIGKEREKAGHVSKGKGPMGARLTHPVCDFPLDEANGKGTVCARVERVGRVISFHPDAAPGDLDLFAVPEDEGAFLRR